MEPRVAALEQFAQQTGERMARVETKLDHIATDVNQFKWWALGSAVAIVLAVVGTSYTIQQMTVSTFQAAAQHAQQQSQPAPQPPAIIINVPPGTAPAPSASAPR